jgi:hypothetical protein
MEIQFNIWGEYDEITREGETIGLLRLKVNRVIVHEEECAAR